MPPASPALAARLSGDIGAAGTRHCARSDLPVDSGAHAALAPAPSAERAAAAAAAAALCGCVALPPITTRSARRSPAGATGRRGTRSAPPAP